jgi:hypothetical protein
MTPVLFAQTLVEYGVMDALIDKFGRAYAALELSLRTNTETWLLGGGAVLLCLWLFRR